jgi:putative Holliday junction resolvase
LTAVSQGRLLALDYGRARCGCAISDPLGTIATPIEPVEDPGSDAGLRAIESIVSENGVHEVVVGLPVGLSGDEGPQALETRRFVDALRARLRVPVVTYDERFTTTLAKRSPGMASEHSRAAAHLLSEYLARGGGDG